MAKDSSDRSRRLSDFQRQEASDRDYVRRHIEKDKSSYFFNPDVWEQTKAARKTVGDTWGMVRGKLDVTEGNRSKYQTGDVDPEDFQDPEFDPEYPDELSHYHDF